MFPIISIDGISAFFCMIVICVHFVMILVLNIILIKLLNNYSANVLDVFPLG